ncbi:MAG: LuxR C-terminal-related transcriptional regulator [Pseudomonadota bacterium]
MWLIRTKLEAPAPTERLIARPRLRRRLPAILRARVALVHAPAGFGKTCLLAEWRRCLVAQRVRTAWLSLDEEDSEPLQFLAYFTTALATAGLDMGSLGPAAERGFPDVPVESLIAALDQCVRRSRGRTVVLLDDCHRLQGARVHRALAALIRAVGSRVTFVLAARELAPLLAQDAALQANCLEIPGDELRFGIDETRSLLERTAGPVAASDLDAILAGTDGWAIAIAAVRDWLHGGWSTERVREALARPTANLGQYVTEQILASLSPAELEFLLRTAIVDRFSHALAGALAPDLPHAQVIASLERKDLVVVIADSTGKWYRYHRLLSELALARLAASRPYLVDELHRRAADWFVAAGLQAEAVRHALATRDDRLLAAMFEGAGGWQLAIAGYVGLARNSLTLIPPEVLRDYPRAQLARVLLLAKLGQVSAAREEIDLFHALHLEGADATLAAEGALLDACIERYEDLPVTDATIAKYVSVADAFGPTEDVLRATHANILSTLYYEHGELDAALDVAVVAALHYRRTRSVYGEVFVSVHEGSAMLERGRLRDAIDTLRQAWQLACDTTGPNTETESVAATMLASALHSRGHREDAQRLLETALPSIEAGEGWYDVLAVGYTTALRVALEAADFPAARRVVARVRDMAARRGLRRLQVHADVLAVHALAAQWKHTPDAEAAAVLSRVRAALDEGLAPRLRVDARIALATISLARGALDHARDAARSIAAEAQRERRLRAVLEARLIEARSLAALDDAHGAERAVDGALALAMYEGWLQPFVANGRALRALLPPPTAGSRTPRVRERFLAAIEAATRDAAPVERAAALSERERAVAGLLGQGLSNKAIGRAMRVSDNTVQFHLKNIYAKHGVVTRSEAARVLAGEPSGARP